MGPAPASEPPGLALGLKVASPRVTFQPACQKDSSTWTVASPVALGISVGPPAAASVAGACVLSPSPPPPGDRGSEGQGVRGPGGEWVIAIDLSVPLSPPRVTISTWVRQISPTTIG